ncbi:uncharacterized protein PHACADRAFT_177767 [Phanerochaete carnosa HHB-10118-sp]|uniref:TLC domain-containing protein n=1 Tax=Phanerochaete carnosa (strain HHB-10118-sp) TaxID=650164 RepID=K5VW64_PHACS|nr:uncharacterized protein PHACADRAFT_177767 [Phanerochaete carnosa HHB-10118-sp]EKM51070.1 hypothetical protein PHACADRAFT_177767 [Phanerochaete carnosa HHB-10118-sp]
MKVMVPAAKPRLLACTAASATLCFAFYYAVQGVLRMRGKSQTERQKSWVLSTLSSATMTLVSLPYLWHWCQTRNVDILHSFADYSCCFFVGYLASDLLVGSMHYRSSISLLTGWIHHLIYIVLLTFLIIPYDFSSLFALLCILELPTFLLAAGSLNSAFRNDYVFATVFFLTRICFHIYITITYALRALSPASGPWAPAAVLWTPTIVLSCVLPMHLLWMKACVVGILKRRRLARQAKLASAPSVMNAAPRIWYIPAYLLSRPLVSTALDQMHARRLASTTLLRRSRQHVLRLLHDALRDAELAGAKAAAAYTQQVPQPPKWRSIRRRVAGRIRRSLPEYDGVALPPVAAELDDSALVFMAAAQ